MDTASQNQYLLNCLFRNNRCSTQPIKFNYRRPIRLTVFIIRSYFHIIGSGSQISIIYFIFKSSRTSGGSSANRAPPLLRQMCLTTGSLHLLGPLYQNRIPRQISFVYRRNNYRYIRINHFRGEAHSAGFHLLFIQYGFYFHIVGGHW